MNKVSIIIPTYRNHKSLNRAIWSAANQTYINTEIIVVNDCPEERIENHIKIHDPLNIKTINCNVNHGGAGEGARNIGIEKATGDYVFFLDGDDELREDAIEKMMNKKGEITTCWGKTNKGREIKYPEENDELKKYLHNCNIVPPGFLMPLETARKYRYDENIRLGDWDLSIRIARDHDITVVEEPLYIYYPKKTKEMKNIYSKRLDSHIYIHNKFNELYNKYPEAKANVHRLIGMDYIYLKNKKKAREHFKTSYKQKQTLFNLIPILLTYLPRYIMTKCFNLIDKFKWIIKDIIY